MSTCAPWALKNECANPACKHEKDSHHHGKDNCLTLHCDCVRFYTAKEWAEVQEALKRPVFAPEPDEAPDTPRMPGWGPWP